MALPLPRLRSLGGLGVASVIALLAVPAAATATQVSSQMHPVHRRVSLPGGARLGAKANAAAAPAAMLNVTGAGNALIGTSTGASAIEGITDAATAGAVFAGVFGEDNTDVSGGGSNVGVLGTTSNGAWGVEGTSGSGAGGGVYGLATTGTGVEGSTTSGNGVFGESTSNYGVYGETNSTGGFSGSTPVSAGVYGTSVDEVGVEGTNTTTMPTEPYQNEGMLGTSNVGPGVLAASSQGDGLYAFSGSGSGAFIENEGVDPTLQIEYGDPSNNGGDAIDVFNYSLGDIMVLDASGNLTVAGTVNPNKGAGNFSRTRNPNSDEGLYCPQEAEETTEDFGSAELLNGTAVVALGADFKQTIDGSSPYMVFLTPYGETNGLYVASRTAAGFVVRETHGGRSNVTFDYRIVARPYGTRLARLPHVAANPQLRGHRPGGPRIAVPRA